jgi:GH24 family phage-related lysozyme (muramidase)
MRDLITAISDADYQKIASEIQSMKRLWDGVPDYAGDKEQKVAGLMERREIEAKLVTDSLTSADQLTGAHIYNV